MADYVVYQSKLKQGALALLGAVMVGLGVLVLTLGLTSKTALNIGVGIVAILFFGYAEFFIVKQFARNNQLIVLTAAGFYDFSSAIASQQQLIPWANVATVEVKTLLLQRFVTVKLNDPDLFLSSLSKAKLKAVQANLAMGYGEVTMNLQSAKGVSATELQGEMYRRIAVAKKNTAKL